MTVLRNFGRYVNGNPLREFVFGFCLVFGLIWGAYGAYKVAEDLYYRTATADNFFDYKSVEFVKQEDTALIFASTRVSKASYPVLWNDILKCGDGTTYRFYSSQGSRDNEPKVFVDYRTVTWDYVEPFPRGKVCKLESQITMDVRGYGKSQEVVSKPFRVK